VQSSERHEVDDAIGGDPGLQRRGEPKLDEAELRGMVRVCA